MYLRRLNGYGALTPSAIASELGLQERLGSFVDNGGPFWLGALALGYVAFKSKSTGVRLVTGAAALGAGALGYTMYDLNNMKFNLTPR